MIQRNHPKRSIIALVLLLLAPIYLALPVSAAQYRCDNIPEVSLSAPNDNMLDYVCTAAARTFEFLGRYQMGPQRPIQVEIIEHQINSGGYKAFGSYDRQSERVRIMSLPAVLNSSQSPQMYKMPFDQEHYIGALAHELAHAVFHQNAVDVEEKWNNTAHEYIAHATQLGVLAAPKREQIILSEETGPWESGDEISVTYMAFNPTGFAVKSYLHLTQLSNPQPFIKLLLNHKWLYISVP
ncbi:DUF6639 family protein [Motiliproteus sp.]|uniref:DUF6639 family protein n=1 Tax=Motiliproteus sp. TaxID=1898955 RepID=UPI003BAC6A97